MRYIVKRTKSRAHRILFDRDLPFKPRKVENKLSYNRKAKHPNRQIEG
jgi:hypothetical protein